MSFKIPVAPTKTTESNRLCKGCKTNKEITEFSKTVNGRYSWKCKKCLRLAQVARDRRRKEKQDRINKLMLEDKFKRLSSS